MDLIIADGEEDEKDLISREVEFLSSSEFYVSLTPYN